MYLVLQETEEFLENLHYCSFHAIIALAVKAASEVRLLYDRLSADSRLIGEKRKNGATRLERVIYVSSNISVDLVIGSTVFYFFTRHVSYSRNKLNLVICA